MTCVYNAYHAHNLSRTVMSDECKSFKNFQRRRPRQPPFRQFCLELANDLNIEVVPPSMYESCSDDDDGQMMRRTEDGGDNASSGVNISYNKREASYFSNLPLIERRKSRRANHQPISVNRQSSCVWCCRIDHSTGQKHTRHGMKTTWKCSVCEVPLLCKRPRYNGQSCFLLFHEAETLFDPCCAEAQSMQLSVRAHGNRQPPPPRRANNVSAVSAEDVIVPPCSVSTVTAGGTMVQPSASWNDDEDEDFIPENSSSDDDCKSSPEHPPSRRRNIGTITVPERRTRRRVLK